MDPLKILAVGDPHLKISNIETLRLLADKICEKITLLAPEIVIVLGDLHDTHEKINVLAWIEEKKFLLKLWERTLTMGGKFYYLMGNHDIPSNNLFLEKIHPFLFSENQFEVIDTPISLKTRVGTFAFVPYVPPGRFHEALSLLNLAGANYDYRSIFCHQEFKGADYGHSIISRDGDLWDKENALVISGHIHKYGYLQSNILYVGSPYQVSFGEDEEKSISLFTYEEQYVTETRIDLDMPKKKTFTTNLAGLEEIEFFPNDENRLIITDTSVNINNFKASEVYKKVQDIAKVIFKPTDKVFIKRSVAKKTFLDLLRDSVKNENTIVSEVFEEVVHGITA